MVFLVRQSCMPLIAPMGGDGCWCGMTIIRDGFTNRMSYTGDAKAITDIGEYEEIFESMGCADGEGFSVVLKKGNLTREGGECL